LPGSEDVEIDHTTAKAWFSLCDHQAAAKRIPHRWPSIIYTYDLKTGQFSNVNLNGFDTTDFCSHGISLNRDDDGVLRVFVVDHGANHTNHGVRIFRYDEASNTLYNHVDIKFSHLTHFVG